MDIQVEVKVFKGLLSYYIERALDLDERVEVKHMQDAMLLYIDFDRKLTISPNKYRFITFDDIDQAKKLLVVLKDAFKLCMKDIELKDSGIIKEFEFDSEVFTYLKAIHFYKDLLIKVIDKNETK